MQGMFDDLWKVVGALFALAVAVALGVGFVVGRL